MNLFSNGISVNPLNSIVPHSCTQECKMLHIKLSLALKKNKSYSTGVAYLLKIVFYLCCFAFYVKTQSVEKCSHLLCHTVYSGWIFPWNWSNVGNCVKKYTIRVFCLLVAINVFAAKHSVCLKRRFRLNYSSVCFLYVFMNIRKKKWSGCLWFVKFGAQ